MCTMETTKAANNRQEWTQSYKDQLADGKLELSQMQRREKKVFKKHASQRKEYEREINLLHNEIAELKKGQTATGSTRSTPTETITKGPHEQHGEAKSDRAYQGYLREQICEYTYIRL
jgi:hypothetical protein